MAATPAAANNMLKVLRAVMRFAVDRGIVRTDPTSGVRMLRYRSEGFHTWTEAEVAAFETKWPVGSKERLGFDLLLYTAQRSGDVRQMIVHQVRDGRVLVRQEKTGQLVDIPLHPRLQTSLAAHKIEHLALLTTQYGKPFTEKGFGNWVSKAAERAGLPHCSAHGLRKRRPADWRKPDAQPMKSWRSLATKPSRWSSATRARPADAISPIPP